MADNTGLQAYIIDTMKGLDAGTLPAFEDPAPPSDLETPLTQEQINWVKILIAEMQRYNPPSAGRPI